MSYRWHAVQYLSPLTLCTMNHLTSSSSSPLLSTALDSMFPSTLGCLIMTIAKNNKLVLPSPIPLTNKVNYTHVSTHTNTHTHMYQLTHTHPRHHILQRLCGSRPSRWPTNRTYPGNWLCFCLQVESLSINWNYLQLYITLSLDYFSTSTFN